MIIFQDNQSSFLGLPKCPTSFISLYLRTVLSVVATCVTAAFYVLFEC